MARDRANIRTDIWADTDWRELTETAQRLYLLLLSHSTLNYAGVADWRPKRIVPLSASSTLDGVLEAARELERMHFIVADDDTEEILIRSFIKHDGLLKSPNLVKAMSAAYAGIASRKIREVVAFEVQKLHSRNPEMKAWELIGTLLDEPSRDIRAEGSEEPFQEPLTEGFDKPSRTTTATTTPPKGGGGASGRKRPSTPIPDGWQPTETHAEKAWELRIDLLTEAEKFRNDAVAKDKRFANWNMAFSNWLIKAKEFQDKSPQSVADRNWKRRGPY